MSLTPADLDRLAALCPPPVGTVDTRGMWVLRGPDIEGDWTAVRDQPGIDAKDWRKHPRPDPQCHAWRAAMLDWLLVPRPHRNEVRVCGDGSARFNWLHDPTVSAVTADCIARLVLAVADKEAADAE